MRNKGINPLVEEYSASLPSAGFRYDVEHARAMALVALTTAIGWFRTG